MRGQKTLGVIPARLAATRLPNKPLLEICGRPMIQWVWERCRRAKLLDDIVVATPDEAIAEACRSFGANAVLTKPEHPTGTDRVAEVAATCDADIIVNIQGDEPLIAPEALDELIRAFTESDAQMGSLMFQIPPEEDAADPNLVKVVTALDFTALYFSRSPVPFARGVPDPLRYGHVGIYIYRRADLLAFTRLARTPLEIAESLEQLRALESGWKIKMALTDYRPIGVDTPADLERVREALSAA